MLPYQRDKKYTEDHAYMTYPVSISMVSFNRCMQRHISAVSHNSENVIKQNTHLCSRQTYKQKPEMYGTDSFYSHVLHVVIMKSNQKSMP